MKKIICTFAIATSFIFSSSKVAIAIKVKGSVSVSQKGSSSSQKLRAGLPLSDQDRIKTNKNGFVALMYLDDKTVVKILANSDLVVIGDRANAEINKALDIKYGKVAANVKPQKGKNFRISTATSVASVKGTELAINSDPSYGDSFTLIEGFIEITNSITGESTEVNEGETAISTPGGSLEVSQTTQEDLEEFGDAGLELQTQELRFEIEDEDGNLKEILIKFQ